GCAAADYLARPEPLAWALAALMRPGQLTRPALKLECLRRIAAVDLDEERRIRLVDCGEAYLELNFNETEEDARLCTGQENREVREMATTWSERSASLVLLSAHREERPLARTKRGRQSWNLRRPQATQGGLVHASPASV